MRCMNKVILLWILATCFTTQAFSLSDSTRKSSWWFVYKYGSARGNLSQYKNWATAEGLNNISSFSNSRMISIDIIHNRNKMVYGINTDFELRSFGTSEPYFFSFTFRSGYTFFDNDHVQVKALGGFGLGYVFIRFENGMPTSLQDIATNYTDPFARAALFVSRFEVLTSYRLAKLNRQNRNFGIEINTMLNAGVQPVLSHGGWNFGENEPDIDGSRFVGQRVGIPKFYKANAFINIGLAIVFD